MRKSKGDVTIFVKRKSGKEYKIIDYISQASNDLIVMLSQEYDTVHDVYKAVNYDEDAKRVLQRLIELGYGELKARECFR